MSKTFRLTTFVESNDISVSACFLRGSLACDEDLDEGFRPELVGLSHALGNFLFAFVWDPFVKRAPLHIWPDFLLIVYEAKADSIFVIVVK